MIPTIYTNLFYSLKYYPLQNNKKLDVFLKDTAACYKVALLISNHGKARLEDAANLKRIKENVLKLPEFMYDKPVQFICIIFHSDHRDQFLAGENIVSIADKGRDYYHRCSDIFAEEIAAISKQREKVCAVKNQLNNRNLTYQDGLPYMTFLLVAACICRYFIYSEVVDSMAVSSRSLLDQNLYTFITYMFSHTSLLHLTGNMAALLILGSMFEKRVGHYKYFLFCIFTGVYAGVTASIYRAITGGNTKTVGISGVVFAICSALVIYQYKECRRGYMPIIVYMVINYFIGMLNPNTDNIMHLSGIFVGIIGMVLIYAAQYIKKKQADKRFYSINAGL